MSFTPLMIKLVACLLDDLNPSPKVVEFGNQTFDPTLRNTNTNSKDEILPLVIDFLSKNEHSFDRELLESLRKMSPEDAKPHTRTYYKSIGFSEYVAIDVNSTYGSLVMDLNTDLGENYGYHQTFDLVTNNGTGEHIFNQYAVFKNMHDLTKTDGVMLFVLPFYNWLNHGFYNYNPLLFVDLATANNYDILRLSIAGNVGHEIEAKVEDRQSRQVSFAWEPKDPELTIGEFQKRGAIWPSTPRTIAWKIMCTILGKKSMRQMSRLPAQITSLAELTPNINIVAALRKKEDIPFQSPLQGMYAGVNVENKALSENYKQQV